MTEDLVGQVVGTEDSTPLQFNVALRDGAYLQLDDVVVTLREVPGIGPVMTSGVVTQVRARHEGASFGSDVFLISDGVLPAQVQEIAEVSTTRVEPEVYVPPRPGEVVRRATGTERAQALYFDRMDAQGCRSAGAGTAPRSTSTWISSTGPGARTCRSAGSPGVATKTSFALFLLHSIFRSGALGAAGGQRQGPGVQREGRGPAVPRPAERAPRRRPAGRVRPARPARRAVRLGGLLRPAHARRPHRHGRTSPAGPAASRPSGGRSPSSAPRSCCPTCSPTPRTSGTSTRS